MSSFLGLLTKVSFTRKIPIKKDQILTSYRLKLLTILANILTSHLVEADPKATHSFVSLMVETIEQKPYLSKEAAHKLIRAAIPIPADESQLQAIVVSFGLALLQEITFNLVVYAGAEVASKTLRENICKEYGLILMSLVESQRLYDEAVAICSVGQRVDEWMLQAYMDCRRRKMNQRMTVLADCISLEEPIPEDLLCFIDVMGNIYELRGTAYRGVVLKEKNNNIYNYWYMYKKGTLDSDLDDVAMKTQFLDFINSKCEHLMQQYKIKVNQYYDQGLYEQTMMIMETYYKLDPKVELLAQRSAKPKL